MDALRAIQREKYPKASSRAKFSNRDGDSDNEADNDGSGGDDEGDDRQVKKFAYSKEALEQSIESLDTYGLPFMETFQVSHFPLDVPDEHDDLQREMTFYNHTILSVHAAKEKIRALGIPIERPSDFFCEQLKTDAHMAKIKDRLIVEERKIEAFEKRKNREHNKKFGKQVAELKQQEIAKRKREAKEGGNSSRGRKIDKSSDPNSPGKSKKRLAMDRKYGRGNKDAKKVSTKSLNDMKDFNPRGGRLNARPMGRIGKSAGKGNKKPNRPGKAARDLKRSKSA